MCRREFQRVEHGLQGFSLPQAVSYTHLDVYKRQIMVETGWRAVLNEPVEEKEEDMTLLPDICLLYTSTNSHTYFRISPFINHKLTANFST